MNFSIVLTLLALTMSAQAIAQVNVSQPVAAGPSDRLFLSNLNSNDVYYFPVGLIRRGEAILKDRDDGVSVARFNIGYSVQDFERVQKALVEAGKDQLKIRFFRPIAYEVLPGTDVLESQNPKFEIINDLNFDGSTEVAFMVDSNPRRFGRRMSRGLKYLHSVFDENLADHIATIRYDYIAFREGVSGTLRTNVGVYAGEKPQIETKSMTLTPELFTNPVLDDSVSHCWDSTVPGVLCFRKVN